MHFCKHRLEIVSNASGDFPSPSSSSSSCSSCSPLPHSYSDKQPPLSREQSRSLARNYSQFPGFEHFPVKVSFFPFPSLLNCLPFSVSLSLSLSSSLAFLFFFLRSTSNSKCYLLMNSRKHSHADVGADSTKPSFSCPGTLGRSVSVVLRPILRVDEAASN